MKAKIYNIPQTNTFVESHDFYTPHIPSRIRNYANNKKIAKNKSFIYPKYHQKLYTSSYHHISNEQQT